MSHAPIPNLPILRGRATPSLLAMIVVSKYLYHLPLYRQSEIYAREGVDLSRSTLADYVAMGQQYHWLAASVMLLLTIPAIIVLLITVTVLIAVVAPITSPIVALILVSAIVAVIASTVAVVRAVCQSDTCGGTDEPSRHNRAHNRHFRDIHGFAPVAHITYVSSGCGTKT